LKVDYLVAYSNDIDLNAKLVESLQEVLEYFYDDPPGDETLMQWIDIRYTRTRDDGQKISGVTVDFDIDDNEVGLIRNFSKISTSHEGIEHVLKLHDPALYYENQRYALEIFEIEMRLREALSFIFIDTYGANFYELLKDTGVGINKKESPQEREMKEHCENQFYFLVFSQYIQLTTPKHLNLDRIVKLIRDASDFDELQRMISGPPIVEEKYIDFLASLNELVEPIERLRNCVAHNRTVSTNILNDYNMAKEVLLILIQRFLEEVGNTTNEEPR